MRADGSPTPEGPPSVEPATDATQSDRVVAVAAEVFAERGFGATLAEIAERAGVGVASVYRRFASKDDLITKVYEPRLFAAKAAVENAVENPDPWAAFEGYFRDSLREVVEDKGFRELTVGAYARSLGWSRSGPPDRLLDVVERVEQSMVPHHVNLVRRAQASGHIREDMEPTDMLVLTMAALSTAEFAGGAFPGLPDRVATFILDGLRPRRDEVTPLAASPVTDAGLHALRSVKPAP